MSEKLRIWRLHSCSNEYTSLDSPAKSDYFNTHFIAERMMARWVPPEVSLSGKSKKLADIMGWAIGAVLLSQRAKLLLEPVLANFVEFLPFYDIKNKPYFAMNVIQQMSADILDIQKSNFLIPAEGVKTAENVKILDAAVFKDLPDNLPPIFKIRIRPDYLDAEIYVTQTFVDLVLQDQLTGIELANPAERALPYILDRKSMNVVPGVPVCGKKKPNLRIVS